MSLLTSYLWRQDHQILYQQLLQHQSQWSIDQTVRNIMPKRILLCRFDNQPMCDGMSCRVLRKFYQQPMLSGLFNRLCLLTWENMRGNVSCSLLRLAQYNCISGCMCAEMSYCFLQLQQGLLFSLHCCRVLCWQRNQPMFDIMHLIICLGWCQKMRG